MTEQRKHITMLKEAPTDFLEGFQEYQQEDTSIVSALLPEPAVEHSCSRE